MEEARIRGVRRRPPVPGAPATLGGRVAAALSSTVVASPGFAAVLTGTVFCAGGGLGLLIPFFPQEARVQEGRLLVLAVLALLVGVGMLRWGRRLPPWATHVVILSGTVSVTLAVALAGLTPTGVALASFYVFTALDAGMCFTRSATACHVLLAVLACAAVMIRQDATGAFAAVVISGTTVVVAMGSGWLLRVAASADADPLTGLPNRRRLDAVLQAAVDRAQRTRSPLSVALLDLDNFKVVNDTLGHDEGDRLLLEVTHAWMSQLSPGDLLARQGGDEFVVVLPGSNRTEALARVERLLAVMPPRSTCSAGLSDLVAGDSLNALMRRADSALYEAKRTGRNRAVPAPVPA
jgi:diguanylate cyclase (GGDEF)-like protein